MPRGGSTGQLAAQSAVTGMSLENCEVIVFPRHFSEKKMVKVRRRPPIPAGTGKYDYPRVQPGGQSGNTIRIKKRRRGSVRGLRSGPGHRALEYLSVPRQFARRSNTAPGGWTYDWGAMATLLTALHANTIDLFGLMKLNWNRAAVPYVGAALPTPGSVSANFDHYFRQQVDRILPATDTDSLSVGALDRLAADARVAPGCAPLPSSPWHESSARGGRRARSDRSQCHQTQASFSAWVKKEGRRGPPGGAPTRRPLTPVRSLALLFRPRAPPARSAGRCWFGCFRCRKETSSDQVGTFASFLTVPGR